MNRPHHTFLDQTNPALDQSSQGVHFETNPIVKLVNYYNTFNYYNASQYIDSNCADITFFNNSPVATGSTFTINGLSVPPQQGLSFTSNDMELDTTKYQLIFNPTGVFIVQNCLVIRKMYVNL